MTPIELCGTLMVIGFFVELTLCVLLDAIPDLFKE